MTVGLKTQKPLTSKGFSYQCLLFLFIVVYRRLFADAKFAKDIPKHLFVINMSSDGAQRGDGTAQMERQ